MTVSSLPEEQAEFHEWTELPLLDFIEPLESGSRPKGGVRGIDSGIPSVGGEHLTAEGGFSFAKVKYVPKAFYANMRRGHIRRGDILIVKDGATTGKVALVRDDFPFEEAVVNEHVFIIRPKSDHDSRYLFWYLHSKEGQERVLEHFQGAAQGGINQRFAPGTLVPIPPTRDDEAKIATQIEALVEALQSPRHRLTTIPRYLKEFRQSVLAAACSGHLTADWREESRQYSSNGLILDLKSKWSSSRGRQLADAITQDVTELPGLPDTWEYLECTKLTDPSRSLTYGVIKLGEQDDDGVPCLRSSDVRRLHINESQVKKISREIEGGFKRTSLLGGEVVVTVRGTLGGVAVVPLHMRGFNVSREVAVIPIADPIIPSFVAFAIASEPQSKWLGEVAKGVAYTGINIEDLCRLPIPVPPLEEQAEIVRRVDSLFALADSIESRLAEATTQVERTTQAILAKAFRGEL